MPYILFSIIVDYLREGHLSPKGTALLRAGLQFKDKEQQLSYIHYLHKRTPSVHKPQFSHQILIQLTQFSMLFIQRVRVQSRPKMMSGYYFWS
jgi:hypothetical protein